MSTDHTPLPITPDGIQRLPISDFDLSAITHDVEKWQTHGKFASYDITRRREGVAKIFLENLAAEDGSLMIFEIHKLGRKGLFRMKAFWVVQLYSALDTNGSLERHGCVWGKMCVSAIHQAHLDVKYGFMSIADFEMASQGPD